LSEDRGFAVDDGVLVQRGGGLRDLWERRGEIAAAARLQKHLAVGAGEHQKPEAIPHLGSHTVPPGSTPRRGSSCETWASICVTGGTRVT
jgi:hypothetical protein